MSAVGIGKDAKIKPEHTVACRALRSVGQNQCREKLHLRTSEPLQQEPGNQNFILELICETGGWRSESVPFAFLDQTYIEYLSSQEHCSFPKCPPFPAAHRSPTQVWAVTFTVGLRRGRDSGQQLTVGNVKDFPA